MDALWAGVSGWLKEKTMTACHWDNLLESRALDRSLEHALVLEWVTALDWQLDLMMWDRLLVFALDLRLWEQELVTLLVSQMSVMSSVT